MQKLRAPIALTVMSVALVHCSSGSSGSAPPTYAVGGQVSGLAGTGLVLHSSLGESLAVTANGAFAFATKAAGGTAYTVTVAAQPTSPSQTCTVSSATGTLAAADVTNVSVSCTTNSYTVGGTVAGLESRLVLRNGSDTVEVDPGAEPVSFTFPAVVPSGGSFLVEIDAQPSGPTQTCNVSGGSGIVGAGDVTSVVVNCTTDAFTIGGTISGLAGTLVLANGGEEITVTVAEGTFAFPTPVPSGDGYLVTVVSEPTSPVWQRCTIADGTEAGTVGAADVTSVVVTCTSYYTVGGSVSGLLQPGLVLQSGVEELEIDPDASGTVVFVFNDRVAADAEYAVTVVSNPPTETCSVANASGTIVAADVSDVAVVCACNPGLDNCDSDASNGCETSLDTISDCGSCGTSCSVANGAPACTSGACAIESCTSPYRDCANGYADGCETDVTISVIHCGVCGNACSSNNGTPSCTSGSCAIACNNHWDNCDVDVANGCETDLKTEQNCGGCGVVCAPGQLCKPGAGGIRSCQ
jgi:hypothetical protein